MEKNESYNPYNLPFNKVDKSELVKVCVDPEKVQAALTHFNKDFNIVIEYGPTDITPRIILQDNEKKADITGSTYFLWLKEVPKEKRLIAYKRADDILDSQGVRIMYSKEIKKNLELLKFNDSKLKWLFYKFKMLFKKKAI